MSINNFRISSLSLSLPVAVFSGLNGNLYLIAAPRQKRKTQFTCGAATNELREPNFVSVNRGDHSFNLLKTAELVFAPNRTFAKVSIL
jgi:hypothetical protein